ncbi:MAG: MFS transporter [Chloroflexi bacterium]|nr:MFS transporter [Chloroflexota bacterium]
MHKSKFLNYLMFGLLYFTQGTVLAYFLSVNALYFNENGLSGLDLGIFSTIAMIPFVIKILYGMLSDRYALFGMGHRKPYILVGLAVQVVSLVLVPFIDLKSGYWLFVGVAFVLQMGMALYDTCTDGLALDTVPEEEEGTIQAIMVGGRALGLVLTAPLVGLLAEYVGWNWVFWSMAITTLFPLPLVLGIHAEKKETTTKFNWGAFRSFKDKYVVAIALVGFVFFAVYAGVNAIVNLSLEMRFAGEFNKAVAGLVSAVLGSGIILGGIFGGRVLDRLGKQKAIWAALLTSLTACLVFAFIPNPGWAWGVVFVVGLSFGVQQTIIFALSMNATDTRIAASMYSILMAVTNVAQAVGMFLSASLTDGIGFVWVFVVMGAINLLSIPFIRTIHRGKNQIEPVA